MNLKEYWEKYKQESGTNDNKYSSNCFCDNEADTLELPQIVDLNIITDFSNNPMCIVETTRINTIPLKDVTSKLYISRRGI